MEALRQLIDRLEAAAEGQQLSLDDVKNITWPAIYDRITEKVSEESWRRLRNFVDDEDIRARDPQYDRDMRNEMKWRAKELRELLTGGDPFGRKR